MIGVELDESQACVDGCAIPAFSMPLVSVATGFARLGAGEGLSPSLANAQSKRIRDSNRAKPNHAFWKRAGLIPASQRSVTVKSS